MKRELLHVYLTKEQYADYITQRSLLFKDYEWWRKKYKNNYKEEAEKRKQYYLEMSDEKWKRLYCNHHQVNKPEYENLYELYDLTMGQQTNSEYAVKLFPEAPTELKTEEWINI